MRSGYKGNLFSNTTTHGRFYNIKTRNMAKEFPKRKSANSASIRQPKSTTKTLPNFANTSPKKAR